MLQVTTWTDAESKDGKPTPAQQQRSAVVAMEGLEVQQAMTALRTDPGKYLEIVREIPTPRLKTRMYSTYAMSAASRPPEEGKPILAKCVTELEEVKDPAASSSAWVTVILCSRREAKLKEVRAEIERTGRRAEFFVLDVCKLGDIQRLKEFILERFGRADILANNAGFTVTKPAWEVTEEEWNLMLDTGFKGLFFCCQVIGSIMRREGYGDHQSQLNLQPEHH